MAFSSLVTDGETPTWCAAVVNVRNTLGQAVASGRIGVISNGREINSLPIVDGTCRICDIPGTGVALRVSSVGCLSTIVEGVRPSYSAAATIGVILNGCDHVDDQRFEFVFVAKVPGRYNGKFMVNGRQVKSAVDEFGRLFLLARPFGSTPVLIVRRTGESIPCDRDAAVEVVFEDSSGVRSVVSFDGRREAAWEQFREFAPR